MYKIYSHTVLYRIYKYIHFHYHNYKKIPAVDDTIYVHSICMNIKNVSYRFC